MNGARDWASGLFLAGPLSLGLVFLPSVTALAEDSEADGVWHQLELELGLGYQSGELTALGRSDQLSGEGWRGIGGLNLDWRSASDAERPRWLRMQAESFGPSAAALTLDYNVPGEHRSRIDYRYLPRRLGDGLTPFEGAGTETLTLPQDWQSGSSTAAMELEENLNRAPYGHVREDLRLAHERTLNQRWQTHVTMREEQRRGNRPAAAVMGSTGGNVRAALVPAPVDYTTREAELGLRYQRESWHWELSYFLSLFDNGNFEALRFDNPFSDVGGWHASASHPQGRGHLGLPPSNQSQQLRSGLGYVFSPRLRLSTDLQLGRSEQDEAFLPYTINPDLSVSDSLPRDSLDGRVDLLRVSSRLNWRPMDRLRLDIRHHYEDRDNQTPVDVYNSVGGDAVNQTPGEAHGRARRNLPVSFTEHRLDLDAGWRLSGGGQLRGGYRRKIMERDFSEVGRTEEDRFRLGLRRSLSDRQQLSIQAEHSRRRADEYDPTAIYFHTFTEAYVEGVDESVQFENHPLLRRYNLADRDQYRVNLRWDMAVSESLHWGANISQSRDDYKDSPLGLERGQSQGLAGDVAWYWHEDWSLDGFATVDTIEADQRNRSFRGSMKGPDSVDPDRDWYLENEDRVSVLGGGVNFEPEGRDLRLRLEWSESRSRSEFDIRSGPALSLEPIPTVRSRGRVFSLSGRHALRDNLNLNWRWYRDRYRSDDWAWSDIDLDTMSGVIASGQELGSQTLDWYSLSLSWDFRPR
ncbi:MtrB/PioB family decaheme-associated outer membrane protein [Natronospira proteinivora]|uniref:MtrB/PioB family decaheme-associated outer membrane protein n=1 Tax=Natronospira proteinivora TaxID=1807133 RepID=A0ABT1G4S8_9GAMM|nr:MtrB/PioB family decaheme-associated outer membrane protein [Natronospira proteinivora]MCP1726286.1 MtrB/PioB family decaheme-associated outer membrane protein [Natronospira proteinivora]